MTDRIRNHKGLLALVIMLVVVILDQWLKIWVKTGFYLGESLYITDWFRLYFIENNGMAFGLELGSKIFLTLFRIVAVGWLIWLMVRIRKRDTISVGFMACLALVTAGAAGNIIDCAFYGLIFDNPAPPQVAQFVPIGEGYAPLLQGRVVDMLYFPLFSFDWPSWMPWVGGSHFVFFQPIFNLADAAISVGIIAIIIFYTGTLGKLFGKPVPEPQDTESQDNETQVH